MWGFKMYFLPIGLSFFVLSAVPFYLYYLFVSNHNEDDNKHCQSAFCFLLVNQLAGTGPLVFLFLRSVSAGARLCNVSISVGVCCPPRVDDWLYLHHC